MMLNSTIGLSTRVNNYDILNIPKYQPSTSQSNVSLNIDKLVLDPFPHPPKVAPCQTIYNPNAWVAQHYSIVEYLAQAPSSMSGLEVLQSYPTQQKTLLSTIGGVDPTISYILTFDVD